MSHVTLIDFEIKDLEALARACAEMGLTFANGQKTWKWYGSASGESNAEDSAQRRGYPIELYGKGEHAIHVPGSAFEIGVCRVPSTGKLTLVYDYWGTGKGKVIVDAIGKGCEKLKQLYGIHAAMLAHERACKAKGLLPSMTRSTGLRDGKTIHYLTINA